MKVSQKDRVTQERRDTAQEAITALLRPDSILLLGASSKRVAEGNVALRNLCRSGHEKKVSVVHPTADQVGGLKTFRHIHEVPRPVDVAYVSLPAASVLDVLRELDRVGCRSAVVPTAGFRVDELNALREFAGTSSMGIHGPNCMGIINFSDDVPLWSSGSALQQDRSGNIALVTQSGSASFLARATEGTGFSKIISTGNEIALRTSDYLRWLAADEFTAAIGVVMESVPDVDDLIDSISTLRHSGKQLVVLKVGRSRNGAAAAAAHTGALLGRDEAYRALFEFLDVPCVSDYDEMAVALSCFAHTSLPRPAGPRVGIVTDSGGEAALMADLAEVEGLELADFTPETDAALGEINPGVTIGNPLDAGASTDVAEGSYLRSYQQVAADPNVDLLLVVVEAHGSMGNEGLNYNRPIIAGLRAAATALPNKPVLAVASSSMATNPRFREQLAPQVPLLRGMRNGIVAARALTGNRRPVRGKPERAYPRPLGTDLMRNEVAVQTFTVDPVLTGRILAEYGLPLVDSVVAENVDDAVAWAEGRYPVVVKAASKHIQHRSDIGAVITSINDPADVRSACQAISDRVLASRPDVRIERFEVQRHIEGGFEAMLGFVSDPVFGSVVSIGTGGGLVELIEDIQFCRGPISPSDAERVLARTKLRRILAGYRNLNPATDVAPLIDLFCRLSWLAQDFREEIAECDLNPVIIEPVTGAVHIVDALFVTPAVVPSSATPSSEDSELSSV
jgi:acetate---CoA ligase (ADP-forming)